MLKYRAIYRKSTPAKTSAYNEGTCCVTRSVAILSYFISLTLFIGMEYLVKKTAYLESAEDARLRHASVHRQLAEAAPKDVQVP